MALTSLERSNFFFFRAKHPPQRRYQHVRTERLVQKLHPVRRGLLQNAHVNRIPAGDHDSQARVGGEQLQAEVAEAVGSVPDLAVPADLVPAP